MKDVSRLVRQVVGPFPGRCAGAGLMSTQAYVTTPLIGLGVTGRLETDGWRGGRLLDEIVAFDRAEADAANITQTNLVAVSSFNGPQGLLWGFDLLPQPLQRHPCLSADAFPRVYDAQPLLDATRALYGTVAAPRFPVAPGQHVLCAYKALYREGPCLLYGALAVAIAQDRDKDADLFMEDHGVLDDQDTLSQNPDLPVGRSVHGQEAARLTRLVDAVDRIGDNLGVCYGKIFVAFRARAVRAGEVGCVLTAAPYVHLAQDAVPRGDPEALLSLSVCGWEQAVGV